MTHRHREHPAHEGVLPLGDDGRLCGIGGGAGDQTCRGDYEFRVGVKDDCTFAENRWLREEAPTFRSRTGIRVPSIDAAGRAAPNRVKTQGLGR
jgi:hypothetical protein